MDHHQFEKEKWSDEDILVYRPLASTKQRGLHLVVFARSDVKDDKVKAKVVRNYNGNFTGTNGAVAINLTWQCEELDKPVDALIVNVDLPSKGGLERLDMLKNTQSHFEQIGSSFFSKNVLLLGDFNSDINYGYEAMRIGQNTDPTMHGQEYFNSKPALETQMVNYAVEEYKKQPPQGDFAEAVAKKPILKKGKGYSMNDVGEDIIREYLTSTGPRTEEYLYFGMPWATPESRPKFVEAVKRFWPTAVVREKKVWADRIFAKGFSLISNYNSIQEQNEGWSFTHQPVMATLSWPFENPVIEEYNVVSPESEADDQETLQSNLTKMALEESDSEDDPFVHQSIISTKKFDSQHSKHNELLPQAFHVPHKPVTGSGHSAKLKSLHRRYLRYVYSC